MEPIVVIYRPDFVPGSDAETEFDKGIIDSGIKDVYRTITFKTSGDPRIEIHHVSVEKQHVKKISCNNNERERIKLELSNGQMARDIIKMKVEIRFLIVVIFALSISFIGSCL